MRAYVNHYEFISPGSGQVSPRKSQPHGSLEKAFRGAKRARRGTGGACRLVLIEEVDVAGHLIG